MKFLITLAMAAMVQASKKCFTYNGLIQCESEPEPFKHCTSELMQRLHKVREHDMDIDTLKKEMISMIDAWNPSASDCTSLYQKQDLCICAKKNFTAAPKLLKKNVYCNNFKSDMRLSGSSLEKCNANCKGYPGFWYHPNSDKDCSCCTQISSLTGEQNTDVYKTSSAEVSGEPQLVKKNYYCQKWKTNMRISNKSLAECNKHCQKYAGFWYHPNTDKDCSCCEQIKDVNPETNTDTYKTVPLGGAVKSTLQCI